MDYREFENLGQQVSSRVRDAIDSLNFDQLNQDIRNTADDVISGVKRTMNNDFAYDPWNPGGKSYQRAKEKSQKSYGSTYRQPEYKAQTVKNEIKPDKKNTVAWRQPAQDYGFPVTRAPRGEVSGILFTVFGALGFGMTTLIYLCLMIMTVAGVSPWILSSALGTGFLPFEIGFAAMMTIGTAQRNRVKRFRKYIGSIKGKSVGTFKKFAALTGKSEKFVAKDVQHMLELNYFPEGHIDDQKTCLMTTNAIYDQYIELMNRSRSRETLEGTQSAGTASSLGSTGAAAQNGGQAGSGANKAADTAAPDDSIAALEALGRQYMEKIRKANDDIPDTEISNKLYRMELVVQKIFEEVKRNPQKAGRLTQFENYYMPMTIKLVETYRDFDRQPIQGDNIKKAKKDIEGTLDTINEAYEKLYDSMYQETVMDVASDISVLQTLLAQEGLTKGDFEK